MKIETKFDVGDNVWLIHNYSIVEAVIEGYNYRKFPCHMSFDMNGKIMDSTYEEKEEYIIFGENVPVKFIFATKQELLDSL